MPHKVVLINPPSLCVDDDHLEPPLGLLYIASALRSGGIDVRVYDMTGGKSTFEEKVAGIPEGTVFGITCCCTNYIQAKKCVQFIRSRDSCSFTVLGGPNATALPEYTLTDSQCDCVITGEGEDAFLDLVRLLEAGLPVPRLVEGKGRDSVDSYSTPAWDLVDLGNYTRKLSGEKVVSVISSRGCAHRCAHCNSTVMGSGKKARFRTPTDITEEIGMLKDAGFSSFRFNDDNFTGNPELGNLLDALKKIGIRYRIFGRIEDLTQKKCQLLAESGCLHISVGIESLNPDNLRILGKSEQIGREKNFYNTVQYGIVTRAFFMVGLPFDTDENIPGYFSRAAELPFDEFSIYPLIPYPGTMIGRNPEKYGYEIIDSDFTHYVQIGKNRSTAFALRHKNFTENDVRSWIETAEKMLLDSGKRAQAQSQIAL